MVLGLLNFFYFSTRNISLKAYYILLIFQQETSHLKAPVCTGGGGSSNGESWSSQGMLFCLFFIFVMNDVKWMHQKFNYLFGICLCYASSWCFPWKPILVFIFMLLLAPFKGFGNWYFKNNLYILLSANRRFKNSLYNIIFLSALLSWFRTKILFFFLGSNWYFCVQWLYTFSVILFFIGAINESKAQMKLSYLFFPFTCTNSVPYHVR